ncbi:immunity-related GTPase family M protein-like [Microtus ochrogaster]|uniref:Immunity-related GTPase family M protein 1 n=1 Tax=Microtus ochrogaster TaxID=79684 RepID=A0A8J6KUZ3_MICOH|nr:immunity-related GTPase family M protein-like [Microtus ochrogaster]KAH0503857.1 Immunity-related GTPase family M protein 1 [Microtus ochrogaster]
MEEAAGSPEDKEFTCFSDAIAINKDRGDLSVKAVKKIETSVEAGNWVDVISVVKEIKQEASRKTVKIAVTGDSGNGMSSFINALREIGHEEEDSAPTGVVMTTQKPALYSSSKFPNVNLWDLPGTGVTSLSMENYLEEMDFSKYDLIIIIASEQFSSNHVKLAKAMQSMRRRFYVVWTKLDRDLDTSALPEPQLRVNIQKNIQENLQKEGVEEPPIFLVSNFSPDSLDFTKLRKTLTEDLHSIRYDGLFATLFQVCKEIISKKMEFIKGIIKENNLKDGLGISDPNNLEECQKVFQEKFGVDEKSLHQVALTMSQPQVIQDHQQDGWTLSVMNHLPVRAVNFVLCCFDSTHRQQERVLDEAAEKAKKILNKILKDILPPQEGQANQGSLPSFLPDMYPQLNLNAE